MKQKAPGTTITVWGAQAAAAACCEGRECSRQSYCSAHVVLVPLQSMSQKQADALAALDVATNDRLTC
jgi:hypothetical protein